MTIPLADGGSVADFRRAAMSRMESAGYRFVGSRRHSAVKICSWCRAALRGKGVCYKQQFYGINSHRCVQMSPAVFTCTENCVFCWRTIRFSLPHADEKWDTPSEIVDGCIEEQIKILQGFGGNDLTTRKMFYEAERPKHFAISLAGEPTLYPHLGEMIEEIHKRGMSSFLVTNGTLPDAVQILLDNDQQPTQFYVTAAAPSKEVMQKACAPVFADAWERMNTTLGLMKNFRRAVMRLTLAKNLNMTEPEHYAALADKHEPMFLEVKGFMSVGGARERWPYKEMPSQSEIMEFAEHIEKNSSYKIVDKKADSRVVLLTRDGREGSFIPAAD